MFHGRKITTRSCSMAAIAILVASAAAAAPPAPAPAAGGRDSGAHARPGQREAGRHARPPRVGPRTAAPNRPAPAARPGIDRRDHARDVRARFGQPQVRTSPFVPRHRVGEIDRWRHRIPTHRFPTRPYVPHYRSPLHGSGCRLSCCYPRSTYQFSWSTYSLDRYRTSYPVIQYVPVESEPQPCEVTLAEAWDLLGAGDPEAALDAFDCIAEALPADGTPLAGIAVALSALRLDEEAAAMMRQAVLADAHALGAAPSGERLELLIADLARRLDDRLRRERGDADAYFMVAALRVMLDDPAAASFALETAESLGDTSQSAKALRSLLD